MTAQDDRIGLKEAISIGIGGMVGGGIFAVLGLAANLARGGTPVAFLVAGAIALLTAYSYSKLSLVFPDKGGTVKFINTAFGTGVFSGGINNLLWACYIIMLSLYASAFGSYAPNLYSVLGNNGDFHLYASLVIVVATVINYYSIKVVGMIESYAVTVKLLILLGFVGVGAYGMIGSQYLSQLSTEHWESPAKLVAAGMVIFVAYEGFELIANAAPDIVEPEKNIPRAYFYSVLFVIGLYVVIAVITVGSLPFDTIKTAEDYVLAEAAKPVLGQIGFTIITVAALISTFSAINASLYGGSRVSFELAEDDELPHEFTGMLWNQPVGLIITTVATLLAANTLDLESISTAGSMGFLLVFAMVNLAGFKLREQIDGKASVSILGTASCLVALVALIVQQFSDNLTGVIVAVGLVTGCFAMEGLYKWTERRSR